MERIAELDGVQTVAQSELYQTPAVSPIPQSDYVNAALHIQTSLEPRPLLHVLEGVEKAMGQHCKAKDSPRKIDIDIILYGQEKIDDYDLSIPHPEWKNRPFVLIPLADIASTLQVSNKEEVDLQALIASFPREETEGIRSCNFKVAIS